MPSVTFVLKEPKSKMDTLIYLIFTYNSNKLKYSTGQKINPKYWNFKEHKSKEVRSFLHYPELNALLKNLEFQVSYEYRKLVNDKIIPTNERLKIPLNEILRKSSKSEKDIISFANEWIKTTNRKESTIKQLKQTIRNLVEFKKVTNRNLLLEAIDLDFYDEFVKYLINKNYSTNTIGTVIKNIKVFMNEALERGLTTNLQFKNKRFKKIEEESESIYLTEKELLKIYEFDFKNNSRLEKVRDLFIVGCYTGLRFSDLTKLKPENLIDNKTKIKIVTEKTGELVMIPLHKFIRDILSKYDYKLPNLITNQKMNAFLKEIGELTEINDDVSLTLTRGGIKQTNTFKKYELITVHTARRSFATNAYLAAVQSISIMKITGHRTEKAFLKYIKISQEDNANKLINHPFFK
jgi:integrase